VHLSFLYLPFLHNLISAEFNSHEQVLATESVPKLKLHSKILQVLFLLPSVNYKLSASSLSANFICTFALQEDIINKINADPTAGWKAGMNDQFSNYTVSPCSKVLGSYTLYPYSLIEVLST